MAFHGPLADCTLDAQHLSLFLSSSSPCSIAEDKTSANLTTLTQRVRRGSNSPRKHTRAIYTNCDYAERAKHVCIHTRARGGDDTLCAAGIVPLPFCLITTRACACMCLSRAHTYTQSVQWDCRQQAVCAGAADSIETRAAWSIGAAFPITPLALNLAK